MNPILLMVKRSTHRQHVVTVPVDFIVFFLHVKLSEEVERYHRVDVHDDSQQHHRQHQLENGSN